MISYLYHRKIYFKCLETKSADSHLWYAGPGPSGAADPKVLLPLLRDVGPHRIVPMLGSKGLPPSQILRLKLGTFRSNQTLLFEGNIMSERLFSLMEKHQKLDEKLRLAQRNLLPDPHEVGRLKKMKLAIKDRLAQFSNGRPAAC